MKHEVVIEGFGCRLRPVCDEDAEFIVKVRNQERAKGKISATSGLVAAQLAWLKSYYDRANDYYWIIESLYTGVPFGAIGLYDFSADGLSAMPGRWVMLPQQDVNAMAPIFLMYDFAFRNLGVEQLVMSVMPDNRKVIKFHLMCGARETEVPLRYVDKERTTGVYQKWFLLDENDWKSMKSFWEPVLSNYT